jgi:hypothetical protein
MDFLLQRLTSDIKDWYHKCFDGLDLEGHCRRHCDIAETHYDANRFNTTFDLHKERKVFLREVQQMMNLEVVKWHNKM